MLERSSVKDDIRFELIYQPHDPIPVADVRDTTLDHGFCVLRQQGLEYGIERRLGILDHQ
jgi:hypothetical protein